MSALDKAMRYFKLTGEAGAISEKRLEAIRAVRKTLQDSTPAMRVNGSLAVYEPIEDVIVKTSPSLLARDGLRRLDYLRGTGPRMAREMKRRAYLKSLLSDLGMAPETHLVETQKYKYLVQPRLSNDPRPSMFEGQDLRNKAEKAGFLPTDIDGSNIMRAGEIPQIVDSGMMRYPGGYLGSKPKWGDGIVQTEADRQRARARIVSFGRRAKPWMED